MTNKLQLQVIGSQKMHCKGCERTVSFTLSQVPGVQRVKASHKTQLVELETAGAVDLARVSSEMDAIGYQVQPVT